MSIIQIRLSTVDEVKSFVSKILLYDYDFDIKTERYVVDAKSILGIFSLDLSKPLTLIINTDNRSALDEIKNSLKEFLI